MQKFSWTLVVLTCQHKDSVISFQRELDLRQQKGSLSQDTLVLVVQDHQESLGSGGATLNALLVAAEHLSSRAGHTVVTADVLDQAHILILHSGRDFPWSSCSRAFCWLPQERSDRLVQAPVCCLDLLLDCLTTKVCPGSPPGVWVCSTDMILHVPPDFTLSWQGFSGVRALALPGDESYAQNHGVYVSDQQGNVCDIIYRGTKEQVQRALMHDGKVALVSGPVFFDRYVSEKLLQTHVTPPLDGCTYLGLDSGAPPLQLSLFLDILKCLCSESVDQFLSGDSSLAAARTQLWRTLRGTRLSLAYVSGGRYDYMTLSGRSHIRRLTCDWPFGNTLSHIQSEDTLTPGSQIINSILEGEVSVSAGCVVQHCHLQGPLKVPPGCLLSGLDPSSSLQQLALPDDIILQGHYIQLGDLRLKVFTVVGAQDPLEVSTDKDGSSFLNQDWMSFYQTHGVKPEDLWVHEDHHCLLEARLFPVLHPRAGPQGLQEGVGWLLGRGGNLHTWRESWRLSLKEVLMLTHQEAELQWREKLLHLVGRKRVVDSLTRNTDAYLLPGFRAAVLGGQQEALLKTLDQLAVGGVASQGAAEVGLAARCLSCIADMLVCMAAGRGGLRSGPAANKAWRSAYFLLEQGDLAGGVGALARQRVHWLSRPDLLVRAARHYEGAAQILLRHAVMSSRTFVHLSKHDVPPIGQWQEVHCPARLDLAGGWSDTPPIAFQHGGSVTNIAIKVDGKRPIGARARRIQEPRLLLLSGPSDSEVCLDLVCESLDDLRDYSQPHAPGALLKAVCVCSGLASLTSPDSLGEQLMQKWGAGVELHSWSLLPTGSGLGTSSILAGALLAAVYRCTGRTCDTDSLIHDVLYLEQMLTTGGGWQDQVGGLVGGVKVGRSRKCLPLRVEVERLCPPENFLNSLQQHLVLVYTGMTRLARNLLQDVVRSWYSRIPAMVQNVEQLVLTSEESAKAVSEGSLQNLGLCLDRTWQQKKFMAPGCEPASVRRMMDALRPLVLGQSLAGAGGGGFLYLLTRQPNQQKEVLQVLQQTLGLKDVTVHSVEIDEDGLTLMTSS
ncbi:L-fucose kinase isoform X2 [Synchiropus splendidus]|uniref:L-fucose kinase isoform X2 n=1 Tax=Synchiropus splendidus TaxID=270530 RepID=UPI00237E7B9B|nr:L-fucose kinase isoform X2 [Synchiropus splendidus]